MKQLSVFFGLAFAAAQVNALQIFHVAQITALLQDGENYAGCMLRLSPQLPGSLQCRSDFVALDCEGIIRNTKSEAAQFFSSAQLAFITDLQVRLRVSDAATVDGFCVADYIRIDK